MTVETLETKFTNIVSNTRDLEVKFYTELSKGDNTKVDLESIGRAVWKKLSQQGDTPFMISLTVNHVLRGICERSAVDALSKQICSALQEIGVAHEQYILQLDAFSNGMYVEDEEFYYRDPEDIELVKEEIEKSRLAKACREADPTYDYSANCGRVCNPHSGSGDVDPIGCVYMAYRSTGVLLFDDKLDDREAPTNLYLQELEKLMSPEDIVKAKRSAKRESMSEWLSKV